MAVSAAGLVAAIAVPSVQAAPVGGFSKPVMLGHGSWGASGGEPSIISDALGNVYVSAPQGIPAGTSGQEGVAFWASRDHGRTWSDPINIGSEQGGGDSDLTYETDDGTIYVADLNATSNTICVSHDQGASFQDANPAGAPDPTKCSGATSTSQYGYSSDRQWLTADRNGRVYLSYHEFTSADPLIYRDDAHGQHAFGDGPCGPIVTDPAIEANMLNDVTEGSLMSKPVLDDAGDIYMLIASGTQQGQADAAQNGHVSPTVSQAIVAVSRDNCATWEDHYVYDGLTQHGVNAVQFGDIFNVIGIDSAGTLYAAAAGYIGDEKFQKVAHLYVFISRDQGTTWSDPIELDAGPSAHMLPSIVGGQHAGEVAIGYFRTINGKSDPNDPNAEWTYSIAETSDGNTDTPHFTYIDPDPGVIYHYGDICNSGLLCGTGLPGAGKNRSLADFTSAALDSGDCPIFVFAGNPAFAPALPSPASPLVQRPTVTSPDPSPTIPTPRVETLPFVTRQQQPCFPRTAVRATSSPSPIASPSAAASPSAHATVSPALLAPLPNTTMAAYTRTLVIFGLAALFLIAFTGRVLSTPRRR